MDSVRFYKKFGKEEMIGSGIKRSNRPLLEHLDSLIRTAEKSDDESVRYISQNFDKITFVSPFLKITDGPNDYKPAINRLSIGPKADNSTVMHLLGDVFQRATVREVPEEAEGFTRDAISHAKDPNNIGFFKKYVEFLSKDDSGRVTEAERGPVSNIIAQVLGQSAFKINTEDNICKLPRMNLAEKSQGVVSQEDVFRSVLASFFSLKALNNTEEINKLSKLFGSRFIDLFERQIESAKDYFELHVKKNIKEIDPLVEEDEPELISDDDLLKQKIGTVSQLATKSGHDVAAKTLLQEREKEEVIEENPHIPERGERKPWAQ